MDTQAPAAPTLTTWGWHQKSACRDLDSEMFFHPEGERGRARARRSAAAKMVCQTCPVRVQCLEQALELHEPYGIWGGLTEEERKARAA